MTKDSIDGIHETHTHAGAIIRQLLSDATFNWSQEVVFEVPDLGPVNATRESFLIHLFMYSVRHYAQLATIIRQVGYALKYFRILIRIVSPCRP